MKSKFSFFAFYAILSVLTHVSARDFSYTYEGQTIAYTVLDEDAKTCATKAGKKSGYIVCGIYTYDSAGNYVVGDLVLPSNPIDGEEKYTLIEIGDYSFGECDSLTSVVIPNTVKEIKYRAFDYCPNIKYVKIPESLQKISLYTFLHCDNLEIVEFSNIEHLCKIFFEGKAANPLSHAKYLYINGKEVSDVVIPESVTFINMYAFTGCRGITSVKIPKSVESIEYGAFMDCDSLKTAEFTSLEHLCKIKYYGEFSNPISCAEYLIIDGKQITEIEIPESISAIGQFTFSGYKNLNSINIGKSVKEIGAFAFCDCSNLSSVTISNSVDSISEYAFYNCKALPSIIIPNSVTKIGCNAFSDCSSLTSVTIYDSVQTIDGYAFNGCSALSSIVIPNSVTEIGCNAFSDCSSLSSVKISNSLQKISTEVFYNCTRLNSIEFGESVKSIENRAFSGCIGLTSLIIPESVDSIKPDAFRGCSGLTSLTIPSSVKSIEYYAFRSCTGLTSIYYNTENPISCGGDPFYKSQIYRQATLYMPEKGIEKAKETTPWRAFVKKEAYDFTGVENIVSDKVDDIDYSKPYEIYNLNGIKVGDNKENITPGLYIIRQGNKIKKIVVQ